MWDRPELLNTLANLLYAAAALLALYAGIVLVVHLPVFPLREVRVTGELTNVTREQIEEIVRGELRGNFFTLDLAQARVAFEKIAWARKVDVRRHWPDRLELTVEEHVPLARWGDTGLVNTHGEVFVATHEGRLPVFVGPPGSAKEIAIQYAYFRRSLEPLGRQPEQVSVSARRAWTVRVEGGMTLELGRDDLENRLGRFVANYELTMATVKRRIDYADLRYPNGFAVRVPELARAEAKGKAK
jgi:cell division protein FtsQ